MNLNYTSEYSIFNDSDYNQLMSTAKENIITIQNQFVESLSGQSNAENSNLFYEIIQNNIIGNNGTKKYYSTSTIKKWIKFNPIQPPPLRFILALCKIFNITIYQLLYTDLNEVKLFTPISRYNKYLSNKQPFYLYFLDKTDGERIEECRLKITPTLKTEGLPVTLEFVHYNKTYSGYLKLNPTKYAGKITVKSATLEEINILLFDPDVETTTFYGAVGFMISLSSDAVKKPCMNKVVLSSKPISNELKLETHERWLKGLLKIDSKGLFIDSDKLKALIEREEVNPDILDMLVIDSTNLTIIDDQSYLHSTFIEKKDKGEVRKILNLIRQESISASTSKLTESDNEIVFKFLKHIGKTKSSSINDSNS
ncbi:hypothetical protein [Fusibacter sp. JL216-2]|uniref:hypothetical protein n=1 Tax=Fusibacter sp. JL216-2 TaxID=3071453 RepID=UPI003D3567C7